MKEQINIEQKIVFYGLIFEEDSLRERKTIEQERISLLGKGQEFDM